MKDFRTKKYSMTEFKALDRYEDGSIKDMFEHFLLLTDKQIELLADDDYSRYYDYMEELEYELRALGA